jgi:regulator of replication initiation timing
LVTVLRFEQPCDPANTKLLGGEGRFEPLGVVGKKVILEPLRDLDEDEGISLLVTLDSMRSALNDALKENTSLREEVERFRNEETSEDHALAALLAKGAVDQTPFTLDELFSGVDADAKTVAKLFRGKGKAALVLEVKNLNAKQTWSMKAVRLVVLSSGQERAVAVRSTNPSIGPGASGVMGFVVDKSAFVEKGKMTNLFLEIYRHDGLRQAWVELDHRLIGK